MSAPEQTEMPIMLEHINVREMYDGMEVRQVFVVRDVTPREKKDGEPYLQMNIGDRTGTIELVVWPVRNSQYDEVGRVQEIAQVGSLLAVRGKIEIHPQYGARLKVHESDGLVGVKRAREGEYDPDKLVMGPARPVAEIESDLFAIVESIQNPWLHTLTRMFFHSPNEVIDPGGGRTLEHSPFYAAFRDAPAARGVHQAYKHGLLEHTVTVTQTVMAIAANGALGACNVDIAITGALLHDVGKIDLYDNRGLAIEMSHVGLLQGEIPLTYARVRAAIDSIDDFPQVLSDAVLHIVVSHHGREEWGAPVEPVTREAWLVHGVDVLAARLGALDMLEATLPAGEQWTNRDRKRGRGWFAEIPSYGSDTAES